MELIDLIDLINVKWKATVATLNILWQVKFIPQIPSIRGRKRKSILLRFQQYFNLLIQKSSPIIYK